MAEAIFRARVGDKSGWEAASAGVLVIRKTPASENAVEVLREWGIDLSEHRSRQLTERVLSDADLVVTMTEGHLDEIRLLFPDFAKPARTLGSYGQGGDVPDPFGGSLSAYRKARDRISSGVADLILELMEKKILDKGKLPKSGG